MTDSGRAEPGGRLDATGGREEAIEEASATI